MNDNVNVEKHSLFFSGNDKEDLDFIMSKIRDEVNDYNNVLMVRFDITMVVKDKESEDIIC